METTTAYSLVPALATFPRPVSRIVELSFPKQDRQDRTRLREIAIFAGNPGQPLGTYNVSRKMTYPTANSAGRIINIYV